MDAEDQPTIESILDNYGIFDMLDSETGGSLLSELQDRDVVMRTDAAEYLARKMIRRGLDRIIEQH